MCSSPTSPGRSPTTTAAFRSAVDQGSGALSPLEPAVIVAALLMALCCGWGLWRRLAEYR